MSEEKSLVYIWTDGVPIGLRGDDARLCALISVGVTVRGNKRVLAIEDGRVSPCGADARLCWASKVGGMNALVLPLGDGAMGFWAAVDDVYPATCQ